MVIFHAVVSAFPLWQIYHTCETVRQWPEQFMGYIQFVFSLVTLSCKYNLASEYAFVSVLVIY